MKNTLNVLILLVILIGFAFACKTVDRTTSQFNGCITANGEKIGVGNKGRAFSIEAKSGKILKSLEGDNKQGAVVCSAKNEILVVYSDEIINIESGKKTPRRIASSTVIGINSKNNLVSYEGKPDIKKGKRLKIIVEDPSDQTDDLKQFELPLEKLDAVERNKNSFTTQPVKLLNDNALLVFAGGKTRTIPVSEFDEFGPDIWGLFKVSLENGEVKRTKAIDKADYEISLFRMPTLEATKDGKFAAVASSNQDGKVIAVYNTETGEEIFKQGFYEKKESGRNLLKLTELNSLALSKDGSKLAIAGVWSDFGRGRYKKDPRIFVYDLTNKNMIADFEIDKERVSIIDFSNGEELIINFDGKSIAKINAQDGKDIWRTQLAKR